MHLKETVFRPVFVKPFKRESSCRWGRSPSWEVTVLGLQPPRGWRTWCPPCTTPERSWEPADAGCAFVLKPACLLSGPVSPLPKTRSSSLAKGKGVCLQLIQWSGTFSRAETSVRWSSQAPSAPRRWESSVSHRAWGRRCLSPVPVAVTGRHQGHREMAHLTFLLQTRGWGPEQRGRPRDGKQSSKYGNDLVYSLWATVTPVGGLTTPLTEQCFPKGLHWPLENG